MNKITEIIPDDIPPWAQEAIVSGQFFRIAVDRAKIVAVALAVIEGDKKGYDTLVAALQPYKKEKENDI